MGTGLRIYLLTHIICPKAYGSREAIEVDILSRQLCQGDMQEDNVLPDLAHEATQTL